MLKAVFLVNAAKRLTDQLRLPGTDRSPDRYKLLWWISSSTNLSRKQIDLSCLIDHLTCFLILIPIKSKEAAVVVRHLIDRVFSVFGPPETLHSDQGKEFQNQLVKELQSVFGYKKTRTAAYRSQGNSVLERVYSTVHNMLAMYSNLA